MSSPVVAAADPPAPSWRATQDGQAQSIRALCTIQPGRKYQDPSWASKLADPRQAWHDWRDGGIRHRRADIEERQRKDWPESTLRPYVAPKLQEPIRTFGKWAGYIIGAAFAVAALPWTAGPLVAIPVYGTLLALLFHTRIEDAIFNVRYGSLPMDQKAKPRPLVLPYEKSAADPHDSVAYPPFDPHRRTPIEPPARTVPSRPSDIGQEHDRSSAPQSAMPADVLANRRPTPPHTAPSLVADETVSNAITPEPTPMPASVSVSVSVSTTVERPFVLTLPALALTHAG